MSSFSEVVGNHNIIHHIDDYYGSRVYGFQPVRTKDAEKGPFFKTVEEAREWLQEKDEPKKKSVKPVAQAIPEELFLGDFISGSVLMKACDILDLNPDMSKLMVSTGLNRIEEGISRLQEELKTERIEHELKAKKKKEDIDFLKKLVVKINNKTICL